MKVQKLGGSLKPEMAELKAAQHYRMTPVELKLPTG